MSVDPQTLRAAKLKFADDGRPATLAAMGDDRAQLTRNERIKLEKLPPLVWKDIVENYAKNGFDSISEDDMERFKWVGVYQQRPKDGQFMMRIKVPGGAASSAQVRVVSAIARDFGDSIADISTRQAFQIHCLTIDAFPPIMDRLETVGLGVKHGMFGACGDVFRNVVSSPINGLDPLDNFDITPFMLEANLFFSSTPAYADLPRKFKVAVVAHRGGAQAEINCLTFYGVKRSDGRTGYGVLIGGGLSTEPHIAQDMGVFVKPEEALKTMEHITAIYRDFGYRKSRKHSRLKYLVADWGVAKYRAEVEKLLGYALEDEETAAPFVTGYEDHYGVFPQVQAGLSYIGVPVLTGRLTSDQWDAIADIADEFGSGNVRMTVMQSFYLVNVPNEKTAAAVAKLEAIGLPIQVSAVKSGAVACTGIQFCNLAVTETKQRARDIVSWLDDNVKWNESEHFRINVNGCPNSCGQHWIADVGLQGCTKKVDGVLVEHFDVFLGGALGSDARFNRRIKRLSAEAVAPAIKTLMESYQSERQGEETFAKWVERHTDEELEVLF